MWQYTSSYDYLQHKGTTGMQWGYNHKEPNGKRTSIVSTETKGPFGSVSTVTSGGNEVSADAMAFKIALDKHRKEEADKRKAEFETFVNDIGKGFNYTKTKITDMSIDCINAGKKAVDNIINKIKFW